MIFSDGFSNNKESGFTICDADGKLLLREVFPHRRTCNEAELRGVLAAAQIGGDVIITDSQVVRNWVRSGQCQARPDLTPVAKEIGRLLRERGMRLQWLPREQNKAGVWNEGKG